MKMPEIFILTGATQSGKTTALRKWIIGKNVNGILTPSVNGRKMLYNIAEGEYLPFEMTGDSQDTVSVNRYILSRESFLKANKIILSALQRDAVDWIVIDEIGPLELRGEGFCNALKILLNGAQCKALLVVRNLLIDDIITNFNLVNVKQITVNELDANTVF